MPRPNPLRSDLEKMVARTAEVEPMSLGHEECAIAFFDLVDSTRRKIDEGHRSGTVAALQHNAVCDRIGSKFSGTVIKSLGDGVLMTFPSTRDAMLAAVNITAGLSRYTDLETKAGLTVGSIERLKVLDVPDIAGAAVDRCARLQALASAGEIVVDEPFFQSVVTHLSDYSGIVDNNWEAEVLKGIGSVRIRRLRFATLENEGEALDPATEAARKWLVRFIDAYDGIDTGPGDPVHAVRAKARDLLDAGPKKDDPFTVSAQMALALPGDSRAAALGDGWREELEGL